MVSASPLASDTESNEAPFRASAQLHAKNPAQPGFRDKFSARDVESLAAASDAWLDWQCKLISGVAHGAVFQTKGTALVAIQAAFPRNAKAKLAENSSSLRKFATQALTSEEPVAFQQNVPGNEAENVAIADLPTADESKGNFDYVALKVPVAGNDCIVVLQVSSRSKPQLGAVIQLLQWGGHWLSSLNEHLDSDESPADDLLQNVMAAESVYAASISIVNDVSNRFSCDKVSIGIVDGLTVRLVAISQLADFDRRQQLVQMIEAAIDESIDQQSMLTMPAIGKEQQNLLPAHRQLHNQQAGQTFASIPLTSGNTTIGGLCLTRTIDKPFNTAELAQCSEYVGKVAPALDLLCKSQESLFKRVKRQSSVMAAQLLQPGSLRERWKTLAASAALIAVFFFPVTHHVSALANIEGADKGGKRRIAPRLRKRRRLCVFRDQSAER